MSRWKAFATVVVLVVVGSLAGCDSLQPVEPVGQAPVTLDSIAGYLVTEDARGVTDISNGVLTEISPVWYQPTESGQLIYASPQAERAVSGIETQALSQKVAIVPSISNFRNGQWDGGLIHGIITNPQVRGNHIATIIGLVKAKQWAGVDIDYESLAAADRSAYSAFIGDLAAALHQAQKVLTVTAHAKTAEPGDWSGAQAQDWQALGTAADEVRVMAYDYSNMTSPPGAIAPLPWVESVLKLAASEVPRNKIMLGVATYGYDWPSDQQGDSLDSLDSVQWSDAQAIAQANAAQVMWDAKSQSPWFTYTNDQGSQDTVWYEDARSLQAKIALALRYQVKGIFIWRLGGEDPAIWEQLRKATGG